MTVIFPGQNAKKTKKKYFILFRRSFLSRYFFPFWSHYFNSKMRIWPLRTLPIVHKMSFSIKKWYLWQWKNFQELFSQKPNLDFLQTISIHKDKIEKYSNHYESIGFCDYAGVICLIICDCVLIICHFVLIISFNKEYY